jgi:1-acyl-sn-glycerol-3-phosphate acyltransferase
VELLAFVLVTVLSPVLLAGAVAIDLVLWLARRKPWMAVRLVAMAWWFLIGELRGLIVLGALWLRSGGKDTRARRLGVYRLRQSWAAGHLGGVRRLFGLRFEVEGLDEVGPGPVVILMRHASIVDNMLPDALIGRAHDLGLRFVLKRELRMLATIDIGGGWVPTAFVARGSGDTAREVEVLSALAIDLEDGEGILIYPEGTRYTAKKLARAQEIIRERRPDVAPLADRIRHTLPPRLGGPTALVRAAGTDVVFCGHVGFDGFEYISDIWAGGLVGTTIKVRFWRHSAAELPADPDELVRWLYARWQVLDDWVGEAAAA